MRVGFAAVLFGLVAWTTGASAAQVVLNPSDVIGGSGSYGGSFNSGQFNATQILDNQTGVVAEPTQNGFWLNPDGGPANAYIVVDLQSPTHVSQIDLYNTHNSQFNDRGTGNFQIEAGNAVTDRGGGNFDLTGPTTVILSGTLAPQVGDPIADQSFAVNNAGSYRYLKFEPLSVAAGTNGGAGCCGANNYGLNELRVFSSPVPEPASLTLLGIGTAGLAGLIRARRK